MSEEFDEDKKSNSHIIWSIVAFIFVISSWLITLNVLQDMPDRGTFGDMFGAVNALFSGF